MTVLVTALDYPFSIRKLAELRIPIGIQMALFDPITTLLAITGLTASVGIAQWLVLRSRISGAGWWVLATVGGGLGGFFVVKDEACIDHIGSVNHLGLVLFAASVGVAQWLVLRSRVSAAGCWVVATVGALFLSEQANRIIMNRWIPSTSMGMPVLVCWAHYLIPWATQGAFIGMTTAFAMEFLQRRPRCVATVEVKTSAPETCRGSTEPEQGTTDTILLLVVHPIRSARLLPVSTGRDHRLATAMLKIWSALIVGNVLLARLTYEPPYPRVGFVGLVSELFLVTLGCLVGGVGLRSVVVLVGCATNWIRQRPAAISPGETGDRALIVGVVGSTLIAGLVLASLILQQCGVRDDWVPIVTMFAVLAALVITLVHIVVLVVSCLRTVEAGEG